MKKISRFLVIILIMLIALPNLSFAVNCSSAPSGFGGSWAREYKDWCESCGGTYSSSGPSCTPGPNWGGGSGGGGGAASGLSQPFYDLGYSVGQAIGKAIFGDPEEKARRKAEEAATAAEEARQAEIARQKAEEEARIRAAEEARKRQEMYDRLSSEIRLSGFDGGHGSGLDPMLGDPNDNLRPQGTAFFGQGGGNDSKVVDLRQRQGYSATAAAPASQGDALLPMLGDPNVVDLRDSTSSANSTKTVKPDCQWGNIGSKAVDLRCLGLDPNKPITIDPHVVRGEERVFPAQIDPETFENANYNKGFEGLMRSDAASAAEAVQYFEQAQKERPNDPLVHNGLLLAQDILKAREQKEKDDQTKAAYFTLQSYASLMTGDVINAQNYIAQARNLDPDNNNVKFVEAISKMELGQGSTYPERQKAYELVANSLVAIYKQNYPVAIDMLEAAQRMQPEDKFIGMFLDEMRKWKEKMTVVFN